MVDIKVLVRLFDITFTGKGLFLLLFYSLLPLGEIALLLYLSEFLGLYLILALTAFFSLVGFVLAFGRVKSIIRRVQRKVTESEYPAQEFVQMAGILVGALFLITPGFVTDFIGLLLLFTFPQHLVGRAITNKLGYKLKEVYEYLKLL